MGLLGRFRRTLLPAKWDRAHVDGKPKVI